MQHHEYRAVEPWGRGLASTHRRFLPGRVAEQAPMFKRETPLKYRSTADYSKPITQITHAAKGQPVLLTQMFLSAVVPVKVRLFGTPAYVRFPAMCDPRELRFESKHKRGTRSGKHYRSTPRIIGLLHPDFVMVQSS